MVARRISRLVSLLFLLGLTSVLIAACGGNADNAAQSGDDAAGKTSNSTSGHTGGAAQEVKIAAGGFEPASVTIKAGTAVMWNNTDAANHQVHADSDAFKSEILAKDGVFHQAYSAPGTYTYHCHLHSGMKGTIIVE